MDADTGVCLCYKLPSPKSENDMNTGGQIRVAIGSSTRGLRAGGRSALHDPTDCHLRDDTANAMTLRSFWSVGASPSSRPWPPPPQTGPGDVCPPEAWSPPARIVVGCSSAVSSESWTGCGRPGLVTVEALGSDPRAPGLANRHPVDDLQLGHGVGPRSDCVPSQSGDGSCLNVISRSTPHR
jgi:hypothetical protein